MALDELLSKLITNSKSFFWAFVVADGVITNIQITYHPGGEMEVRGLPWEGLSYVLLSSDAGAFLDRDGEAPVDEEITQAFQMCRLWDPRVVVRLLKDERPAGPSKWLASYDIRALNELHPLDARQLEWLEAQPNDGFVREMEFSAENGVLTEMTEEDFSGSIGSRITLQFGYQGLLPPFMTRLER